MYSNIGKEWQQGLERERPNTFKDFYSVLKM